MNKIDTVESACQILKDLDVNLETESILISEAYGRVLSEEVTAKIAVPAFRKSAFDGYALRSADIQNASVKNPILLKVTEIIPAGSVGKYPVTEGMAARIMTGAMVPKGADAVVKYEDTKFTEENVICFAPVKSFNIVEVGEDVRQGVCLLKHGSVIGAADVAVMAGQGIKSVHVYKKPNAAILSTGSELLMQGQELAEGKIYNTNPYLLGGYLRKYGIIPVDCGIIKDNMDELSDRIMAALKDYDMVITTGGVSAGDFDYIPRVVERIGARQLFHGIPLKPGGAMLAAEKEGKVILGLSGNPGAAAVGLLRVGLPYIKKLCGRIETEFAQTEAVLEESFLKPSKGMRILRGKAQIKEGRLCFKLIDNQRNGSVSSMMDCDLLGEIPAGSSEVPSGTKLKVYFI